MQNAAGRGRAGSPRARFPEPARVPDVEKEAARHIQQDHGREQGESRGLRQKGHADERACKNTGESAQGHEQGEWPEEPPLAPIAPDPRRARHDVENLVGGAHAGMDVAKHVDLERQQQKGAGDPPHGCQKRDTESRGHGQGGGAFDTGNGKQHGISFSGIRAGRTRPGRTGPRPCGLTVRRFFVHPLAA